MIMEGHVHKGTVGEPKHDVAHIVRCIFRQLCEDSLDPFLIFIGGLGRLGRIPRY